MKRKRVEEEWRTLKEEEKDEFIEQQRLNYIEEAKFFLKKKNYYKAIESFESVFRQKLDEDVFLQLGQLYKGLKKTASLQDLLFRWNRMVEHNDKLKKYDKLKEQSKPVE